MLFDHFVLKSALPSPPCDILILKSRYDILNLKSTELKKYSAAHCLAVPVLSRLSLSSQLWPWILCYYFLALIYDLSAYAHIFFHNKLFILSFI